jgi:hypothetical protein
MTLGVARRAYLGYPEASSGSLVPSGLKCQGCAKVTANDLHGGLGH